MAKETIEICNNRKVGEKLEIQASLFVRFLWEETKDSNYGRLAIILFHYHFFYPSPNVVEVKKLKVGSFCFFFF